MSKELDAFFGEHVSSKIDYENELNKEQYKAVTTTDGPVLIIAGAGSGKTRVLTYRLAYLIDHGVSPENILLLTFTNKAAKEMIVRANSMLDERCQKVTACTYHSFCAKILRIYYRAAGLQENFSILTPSNCAMVMSMLIENEEYSKDKNFPSGKEIVNIYSYSYNKAISISDVVEIKYPKYETYIKDIEDLKEKYTKYKLEQGLVDYDDLILLVNALFRNKPSIAKKYSDLYKYIMVDEYQDSNMMQLELLKHMRSFDNDNICVVGDDQQCVIEGTLIETKNGPKKVEDITKTEKIIVASGRKKTKEVYPDSIYSHLHIGDVIRIKTRKGKEIVTTPEHVFFIKKNTTLNKDDFMFCLFDRYDGSHTFKTPNCEFIHSDSDKLERMIVGLTRSTDIKRKRYARLTDSTFLFLSAEEIRKGMIVPILDNQTIVEDEVVEVSREKFKGYVYDINISNFRNFVANGICVHNCIYGFRGSNFRNIINFPKEFDETELIILSNNYRSTQEILDLANSVIDCAEEKYDKYLLGTRSNETKPHIIFTKDQRDEARYIFYKLWKYHELGVAFKDMAVLIRNAQDSNQLEALFATELRSIPYKKFGGMKFFDKEIIQDIFSILSIISNTPSEIFWFRILKLYPNIGKKYASKITSGIIKNGMEELLDPSYSGKKYANNFPDIYKAFKKIKTIEDFPEQLDFIINTYYYKLKQDSISESKMKKTTQNDLLKKLDSDIEEAQLLIKMAKNYENSTDFLEAVLLENEEEADNSDYVTVSTIHSAKGLEFKIVFIIDCIDSSFPGERSFNAFNKLAVKEHNDEIEESRRLLYVAITRAKDELFLMVPQTTFRYGHVDAADISRFLEENKIAVNFCDQDYI